MGAKASEYAAAAPHNSYIHVEEFAGAEELATYLHRLDNDDNLYNSYFKWKVRFLLIFRFDKADYLNRYIYVNTCHAGFALGLVEE